MVEYCAENRRVKNSPYGISVIMDYLLSKQPEYTLSVLKDFAEYEPAVILSTIRNDAFMNKTIKAHKNLLEAVKINTRGMDMNDFGNNSSLYDCCAYYSDGLPF